MRDSYNKFRYAFDGSCSAPTRKPKRVMARLQSEIEKKRMK